MVSISTLGNPKINSSAQAVLLVSQAALVKHFPTIFENLNEQTKTRAETSFNQYYATNTIINLAIKQPRDGIRGFLIPFRRKPTNEAREHIKGI